MTVDPKGPLRMNNCSYHYGSKCSFSCAVGYRLNGSSTVTCDAPRERPPGAWDKPIPICQGRESCSGGSRPSDKGVGGGGGHADPEIRGPALKENKEGPLPPGSAIG